MQEQQPIKVDGAEALRLKFPTYVKIKETYREMQEEFTVSINSKKILLFTSDGNVEADGMYESLLDYIVTLNLSEEEIHRILKEATFKINGYIENIRHLYKEQ